MGKFKIFRGPISTQYYFRFNASNGEQIVASEGYVSKQGCLNGRDAVKSRSPYDSAYIRSDSPGNYRFNMIGANYEIIARSSEGYTTRQSRENAIEVMKREGSSAGTDDLT